MDTRQPRSQCGLSDDNCHRCRLLQQQSCRFLEQRCDLPSVKKCSSRLYIASGANKWLLLGPCTVLCHRRKSFYTDQILQGLGSGDANGWGRLVLPPYQILCIRCKCQVLTKSIFNHEKE